MLSIPSINHLIDYCFQINDIIILHVGNNLFYKELNEKSLVKFGLTICTRFNSQNSNLKKQLMDHFEGLFEANTFNWSRVTSTTGTYMEYAWDMYMVQFHKNPRYECPPMILGMEWKALIKKSKEKRLKKEGKIPPGLAR